MNAVGSPTERCPGWVDGTPPRARTGDVPPLSPTSRPVLGLLFRLLLAARVNSSHSQATTRRNEAAIVRLDCSRCYYCCCCGFCFHRDRDSNCCLSMPLHQHQ